MPIVAQCGYCQTTTSTWCLVELSLGFEPVPLIMALIRAAQLEPLIGTSRHAFVKRLRTRVRCDWLLSSFFNALIRSRRFRVLACLTSLLCRIALAQLG
jgi:hypothetical protein